MLPDGVVLLARITALLALCTDLVFASTTSKIFTGHLKILLLDKYEAECTNLPNHAKLEFLNTTWDNREFIEILKDQIIRTLGIAIKRESDFELYSCNESVMIADDLANEFSGKVIGDIPIRGKPGWESLMAEFRKKKKKPETFEVEVKCRSKTTECEDFILESGCSDVVMGGNITVSKDCEESKEIFSGFKFNTCWSYSMFYSSVIDKIDKSVDDVYGSGFGEYIITSIRIETVPKITEEVEEEERYGGGTYTRTIQDSESVTIKGSNLRERYLRYLSAMKLIEEMLGNTDNKEKYKPRIDIRITVKNKNKSC